MSSLLEVDSLRMHFPMGRGLFFGGKERLKAVDGVSFSVNAGETLGIVGESGCGKSTLGKTVAGLYRPTAGSVRLGGTEVSSLSHRERLPHRRTIQMIFQDPADSLNGRMTVGRILSEPFEIHGVDDAAGRRRRVLSLLDKVGLPRAAADKFPFEFSGGQRQRIGIARALAPEPKLIVCDEAVSALDVSIQGQVLNLLLDLQRDLGLAYLFVAHDLSVVRHMSDRVAVMYLGKIVEMGDADEVWREPLHAYTKALISAVPTHDPARRAARILIPGEPPSPLSPPPGCAFGHRNGSPRHAESIMNPPVLTEIRPGRWVSKCACCV